MFKQFQESDDGEIEKALKKAEEKKHFESEGEKDSSDSETYSDEEESIEQDSNEFES